MIKQKELSILSGDLGHVHIMVLGDVMLDRYVVGTASRISPEAPIPVILWKRTENKLGGASNVVANLKSMGCKVSVMGLCGTDEDAEILERLLKEIGCDHIHLIQDAQRPTTVKKRIVVEMHQIARIDYESEVEIDSDIQEKVLKKLEESYQKEKIDVLILQDYNKGFLHSAWIPKIIQLAKKYKIKIAVDPKKHHFFDYQKVDLFKPNLKEALQMVDLTYNDKQLSTLASHLKSELKCSKLMITLASEGIWISSDEVNTQFNTKTRKVADVSGAGDTVISLAAICMACSLSDEFMAQCCNAGGGQVCEKFGVVPIMKQELIDELSD